MFDDIRNTHIPICAVCLSSLATVMKGNEANCGGKGSGAEGAVGVPPDWRQQSQSHLTGESDSQGLNRRMTVKLFDCTAGNELEANKQAIAVGSSALLICLS
jgi:hypothetical protein